MAAIEGKEMIHTMREGVGDVDLVHALDHLKGSTRSK